MYYKSKTNKINNESRAMLALRIIDTVNKSGIADAKVSNAFVQLEELNARYQMAIEPGTAKQVSQSITDKYKERSALFVEMFDYLNGLQNSPDADMKAAAALLFEQISKYGKSFSSYRLADQSLRYIRIIESLKMPEYAAALTKTLLTDKLTLLNQMQLDYEELYMGRGNTFATKVAPSNLSKELNDAIKLYMDEVNWMANRTNTEAWNTLRSNLQKRFDEVNVTSTRKLADTSTESTTTTATV